MAKQQWREIAATVVDWRSRFEGYDELTGGAALELYVVTVTYEVNGKILETRFKTSQRYEEGDTLKLRYDPNYPHITDLKLTKPMRVLAWGIGIVGTAALIWLFERMLT